MARPHRTSAGHKIVQATNSKYFIAASAIRVLAMTFSPLGEREEIAMAFELALALAALTHYSQLQYPSPFLPLQQMWSTLCSLRRQHVI